MALPRMAAVPPAGIRKALMPEEWEACLEAWVILAEHNLALPTKHFSEHGNDLVPFLTSYVKEICLLNSTSNSIDRLASPKIRRLSFLLTHRLLCLDDPPKQLLQWQFLADLSNVYLKSKGLGDLLSSVWRRKADPLKQSIASLIRSTSFATSETSQTADASLRRFIPLLQTLPQVGELLMTGSDLLDEFIGHFQEMDLAAKRSVAAVTYLALESLLQGSEANTSLFFLQVFALVADGQKKGNSSLIASLVVSTPLLARMKTAAALQGSQRAADLLSSLQRYGSGVSIAPHRPRAQRIWKGKGKAVAEHIDEAHVHNMSLVSQIRDLFPELGTGFVSRLLTEYADNVELATAALLDDSLPPALQNVDRSEMLQERQHSKLPVPVSKVEAPLANRLNVFDGDELDRLAVDSSRLHIGKRNDPDTMDSVLFEGRGSSNKAAIMSALAAFDSDDDERDDTYDVEDVGGTVDTLAMETDQTDSTTKNEQALFLAFKQNSDVFNRDSATRRSQARLALKGLTGLTDEAIEGWYIVTGRDSRNLKRLESRYATWDGQQDALAPTSWRDSGAEDSGDASGSGPPGRGRFNGRARGAARGRGRNVEGGGSVGGASGSQQARQRKETNKASQGNHDRRQQRARKMARGGFGA